VGAGSLVRQGKPYLPEGRRCTGRHRHNVLKSSGTSPNFRNTVASRKSPVAGSLVRLNAIAPVSDGDLRALIDLGLVEMRDGAPVLTQTGHDALD
jgi:hypothetical protein